MFLSKDKYSTRDELYDNTKFNRFKFLQKISKEIEMASENGDFFCKYEICIDDIKNNEKDNTKEFFVMSDYLSITETRLDEEFEKAILWYNSKTKLDVKMEKNKNKENGKTIWIFKCDWNLI